MHTYDTCAYIGKRLNTRIETTFIIYKCIATGMLHSVHPPKQLELTAITGEYQPRLNVKIMCCISRIPVNLIVL